MHREQAQHEHNRYQPVCHGIVELDEVRAREIAYFAVGFSKPIEGPWFCPDCDWQEGKKATSLLPDLGTELPNVETH